MRIDPAEHVLSCRPTREFLRDMRLSVFDKALWLASHSEFSRPTMLRGHWRQRAQLRWMAEIGAMRVEGGVAFPVLDFWAGASWSAEFHPSWTHSTILVACAFQARVNRPTTSSADIFKLLGEGVGRGAGFLAIKFLKEVGAIFEVSPRAGSRDPAQYRWVGVPTNGAEPLMPQ